MASSRTVFISYNRDEGEKRARRLSRALADAGHRPWLDVEQQPNLLGKSWQGEIEAVLQTVDVVVVLLTPKACASPIVQGELTNAHAHQRLVIPALCADCDVPVTISALHHLDFRRDEDWESQLNVLLQRLDQFQDVAAQAERIARGIPEEKARSAAEAVRAIRSEVRCFGRRPPSAAGQAFYDRVDQQAAILDALEDRRVRMVSILGRGGMGKSALACCVLSRLEKGELPGDRRTEVKGIAYLHHTPTQGITFTRVLEHVANVLPSAAAESAAGILRNRDLSTEERLDRFLALMPDHLIVALLDNFEDLLDERGRIRDADLNLLVRRALIDQGSLRLLVTARAAINLDARALSTEKQIHMSDGLPADDAMTMLRELDPNGQFGLATASDDELRAVVEKTYGIPRALELVPNILKGDEGAGLLQGLSELADGFWAHENVVEKLVEENYRAIPAQSRRIAEALAVFARPVPKVAVDFLLQPHDQGLRFEEVLQPLVNARLVYLERGGEGRATTLGLHRIDRDFLYQRLPTQGTYCRTTLHRRAAEFYRTQRIADARSWKKVADLQPQISEYEHLVQAGDYDAAAILLGEYAGPIAHCGNPTQIRDLHQKLPDRLTSDRARIAYGVTALVWKAYLGPISEGLMAGEHALELATACQDAALEVQVRSELVTAYRYASNSTQSAHHGERVIALVEASPELAAKDPAWYHQLNLDLVLAYTYQGDVRRAAPLAQRLYDVAHQSQDPALIGSASNARVIVDFAAQRYIEAVQFGRETEKMWKRNFHDGIAYTQNIMGMSMYLLGDYRSAVDKLDEAIATAKEWGSPRPEALALWNLSLINLMHGVNDKALNYGRDAEMLMTRLGLDRSASAPRSGAEAAIAGDSAGVVRALLTAAREWTRCGDLFPGPRLAQYAGQFARLRQLDVLAADADALVAEFDKRLVLPETGT